MYDKNGKALRKDLSGYKKPLPFVVKTNQVSIIFKSDDDNLAIPDGLTGAWNATIIIKYPKTSVKKSSSEYFRASNKEQDSTVKSIDGSVICSASCKFIAFIDG